MKAKRYDFFRRKYGSELLIDLIQLESLEKYILHDDSHYVTYYDITIVLEGKGSFSLDDHKFNIEKNKIIFSSPFQIRKWEIDKAPKGIVLIFEEEFICDFFNDKEFVKRLSCFHVEPENAIINITDEQSFSIQKVLTNIEEEIHSFKNNHLLRALLYQALIWFDENYRKKHPSGTKTLNKKILEYENLVGDHFNIHHSVHFYSDKLCLTSGHLNDLVKKETGKSAKQIIQKRIIQEAKKLLSYTDMQVSEISMELGYDDVSYFIRMFRKFEKLTPLSFRKLKKP